MIFCGTTLFAAEAAASTGCQHTRCPITPALRQKILGTSPFPLPSAAHLPTRFSLRSQLHGTLCGCAADFTSASTVSYLSYAHYTPVVSICQALFFISGGHFLCRKEALRCWLNGDACGFLSSCPPLHKGGMVCSKPEHFPFIKPNDLFSPLFDRLRRQVSGDAHPAQGQGGQQRHGGTGEGA